ncbi:MAG: hypothetical protein ACREEM_13240, partial [Blastocatellia bacterium]
TGLVPDRGRDTFGTKLTMPTEAQKKRFDELTQLLKWTETELDEKAEGLSARRAEWEKQMLEWRQAGNLAWQFQRPIAAKSANGATLMVYNDEPLVVSGLLVERFGGPSVKPY